MTLAMPDSIHVQDLPTGYPAYLGYADGDFQTADELAKKFPAAQRVILTVNGTTIAGATGCDVERFDLTPKSGADWAKAKLAQDPASKPVMYSSVSAVPAVLGELSVVGIQRKQVRLHSAHYGWITGVDSANPDNRHICGPATCAWPGVPACDGTQWTSGYPGVNGALIDMSLLRDDFFTPTEAPVGVQIPGIPGTWLSYTAFIDAQHGVEYVVGTGTNGQVYYTKRAPGVAWSAPAVMP